MIRSMKEREYIRPEIVKFGFALALSLGGVLYYLLRAKRVRHLHSPPPSPHSSDDNGNGRESEREAAEMEHDLCLHADNLPGLVCNGFQDGFSLSEFDELVNEFDLASVEDSDSPKMYVETLASETDMQTGFNVVKRDDYEQEIKCLRNMVRNLKERERVLEIQLLEYYGLKEQEAAVMELHNRLKINSMEAKLFNLKIESLQADNKRLEAQVTDHAKIVADFEVAKAKIKMLKRKLKSESEQNREHMSSLQKIKHLEEEVEELRKSNRSLQLENSDLGRRLDYAQILANSVLENEETEALKEENELLKKRNEELTKEIEQTQDNQCTNVEELVYLRWINACLRYELRNYQPRPGETAARDLSKTLSPKSEEKAKQLILRYADKEELSGRRTRSADLETSSQGSFLTDCDDIPLDHTIAIKTHPPSKKRVFGKLLRLLRGHRKSQSQDSSVDDTQAEEDVVGRDSSVSCSRVSTASDAQSSKSRVSLSSCRTSLESSERQLLETSSVRSLDLLKSPHPHTLKGEKTDAGSPYTSSRNVSTSEDLSDSPIQNQINQELENNQKFDLLKYAEALKNSRGKTPEFQDSHGETHEFPKGNRSTLERYASL